MKLDRKSLGTRFLLPILALFLVISLGLLMLITRITNHIREDYQEFTVQAAASNVTTILDMAAAELTTAKLTGSPFVVDAKKISVLEAIRISWSRSNQEGVITSADGTVLLSTLDQGTTRSILAHRINGVFSLDNASEHYLCISNFFPLWGWDVITVAEHSMNSHADREIKWLIPGIGLALILLSAGLYLVFRRSISLPVAAMIANVGKGQDVALTGIAEFDRIGSAVNDAFCRERDRTEEVENELGERIKTQGMLKESEEHITLLLDSIAEGIYGVDLQGNCTFCNPAALRILGYEHLEDIIGKKIHSLIHHTRSDGTQYHAKDCKIYRSFRAGKGAHVVDEVFWRPEGTSVPVEYWTQPIMRNNSPIGAVTAFVDISERKQTEESLRVNEERYRSLFDNMLEGFAHCQMLFKDGQPADFVYLDVNNAFEALTGLQNVVGKKVSEVIPGIRETDPKLFEIYGTVALTGKPERLEVYLDALKTWFAISVYSPKREQFVAVFDVITDRKIAEESLRDSERRFREILQNISLVSVMLDTDGRIIQCNDHLLSLTGWKRDEVLNRNWFELFLPPEIRAEIKDEVFLTSIRTGEIPTHYENAIITRQGEQRLIAWSNIVLRDTAGKVTGMAGIGEDITERKRMEDALKRSENLLQTIIDTEPDCVKMIDARGNLILMNRAGLDMLEVETLEEVKGQSVCPLVTSAYRQAFMDLTARIFEGQSGTLIFEMVGLKGRQLWLETRAVPFRDEKNEIVALLGITRDITERLKLEDQLRQSQKMESIGTLAGGVAHDFNNILSAISGYGHLTMMKMAQNDPLRPNIQQILEASDRAAHLTRDLLLFSRKQPIDKKPVDLNEGIQKLSKFLVRVIGEDIAFKTMLSGGTIPVLADAYQIDQVLMNLATNARDAMTRGGTFTIATEQVWLNEDFTAAHGLRTAGTYALITVSDTGEGMDEETMQRIYEPFFTTKEVGKGTGLGLSVVYGIVKQHDGTVTVYSEPGQGTTFRIYLPLNTQAADEHGAAPEEGVPVGGTETILLAEDDRTVREMTQLMLQDFGYTVITAIDGEEAVQRFRENRDRIKLLLFDLIMPKKTGKDAYDEIVKERPGIKIIFASGYDPDMVRQKALLEQNVPVVYKPVSMTGLLKKIRSVLDGENG